MFWLCELFKENQPIPYWLLWQNCITFLVSVYSKTDGCQDDQRVDGQEVRASVAGRCWWRLRLWDNARNQEHPVYVLWRQRGHHCLEMCLASLRRVVTSAAKRQRALCLTSNKNFSNVLYHITYANCALGVIHILYNAKMSFLTPAYAIWRHYNSTADPFQIMQHCLNPYPR